MRIIDIYEYFKKHPGYNKLIGTDFLFVEYKCPLQIEEFQLWTKSHLITYVINGKKDWLSPNQIYQLTAGDALFVRKGVYTTKQYLEEEYCVILFFITDNFIRKFIIENNLLKQNIVTKSKQKYLFKISTNDSFTSLIESVFHYLKKGDHIPQRLIEIKFKELLFNIALNAKNKDLIEFFQTIIQNTKADMEQVMMENFQYDLKMEAYAKLCGRSLSAFKRDFKNAFETTPYKWLITKRLEYATTLLLGTELNVSQICYESGFKSPSHFIRIFKNKYKLPPNQFRSINTKD